MTKNVPAKSESRGIQKQHTRRYKSGAVARVNPGVGGDSGQKARGRIRARPRQMLRNDKKALPIKIKPAVMAKPRHNFRANALKNKFDQLFDAVRDKDPQVMAAIDSVNRNIDDFFSILKMRWEEYVEENVKDNDEQFMSDVEVFETYLEDFYDDYFDNDNGWGSEDRIDVLVQGDVSKIPDEELRAKMEDADDLEDPEFGYTNYVHYDADPWDGAILGDGLNPPLNDNWETFFPLDFYKSRYKDESENPVLQSILHVLKEDDFPFIKVKRWDIVEFAIPRSMVKEFADLMKRKGVKLGHLKLFL